MDIVTNLVDQFLNLVAPPVSFFSLCFFLPPFLLLKSFLSVLGYIFSEDVAGKVVLITGASSGIGENLAYEYARRGDCLALVARRQNRLRAVADNALEIGSPDVIAINGDVSKVEDCRRSVEETINHFGRCEFEFWGNYFKNLICSFCLLNSIELCTNSTFDAVDHLVNNAGIGMACMFEESIDTTEFRNIMDTNFWGASFTTRFALPHLRDTKGKIAVLSSASWLPTPRMSIYNASKAALRSLFETLRVEVGSDVKITIVTPGFVESELTRGKFVVRDGKVVVDPDMRDVVVSAMPVAPAAGSAKAIVDSVCRGDRYLTVPSWFRVTYHWKVSCPEVIEWVLRLFFIPSSGSPDEEALSKKIVDYTGIKNILYPSTIQSPELKVD
ncbi:11-beta-hydroxysteroid dehydrogenase A-like isoform X1 [Tripterygium wilfordii]|uniref:11-beta-hydroxysteroid dehydrogenase A-like isoform X1 n=1 Tax=Tripterygium wilfordii TaxID=458696 RepID=UPI0018F80054|nr:11-beta-hydroxysteroid dehydrogenase A-like isoform X1 [Tripterygium wilfordii]